MGGRAAAVLAAAALACAPTGPIGETRPLRSAVPSGGASAAVPGDAITRIGPTPPSGRLLEPAEAFRRGLMPLRSTRVDRFAAAAPAADGRGVLIAILDSGVDPGVAGLRTTSDGAPKLLDLRDFSGEGRVPLARVRRRGDTLEVAGRRLLGASRVAAIGIGREIWGGALEELPLGDPPAADLNGSGQVGDRLPVVVVRTTAGWALFADTQGNGTLTDDRPVRDFAVAREHFGWTTAGRTAPLQVAVNFADSADAPMLDLFFDTSSHGTHVAGIAAGHDLYGVKGFDGVAPGARLLGLKIANDAQGGVTVTGSMRRALAHAIRVAAERRMPLVVNLSFGVGNEVEGEARIDAIVDSILAAHPDVVMTVAAANDGPGLSTLGFPGSAARVISVGATQPLVFAGLAAGDGTGEPLAPFSSRGGEIGGPDIVVPGTAYSTVPPFATGGEQESGTSMAAPHAAGLAARLLSAARAEGRSPSALLVRDALRSAGRPVPGATVAEQGAGLPDLEVAGRWLAERSAAPALAVDVGSVRGRGGVLITAERGSAVPLAADVGLRRLDARGALPLRLEVVDAPWLVVPDTLTLLDGAATFTVRVARERLPAAPVVGGAVAVRSGADRVALIPVTVRTPLPRSARVESVEFTVAPGAVWHAFIAADSGRPLQVEVATLGKDEMVTAALQEPDGMPFRDGPAMPAGAGEGAALFDLGGGDVEAGLYEIAIVAGPLAGGSGRVTVRRAPLRLEAAWGGDSLTLGAVSLLRDTATVALRAGQIGAERRWVLAPTGDAPIRLAVPVPAWAKRVVFDTRMPPGQWGRFTDFGVTLQEGDGRHLLASPMNYAFGRLAADVPERLVGDTLVVLLSPAFADTAAPWRIEASLRFYADAVAAVDGGGAPRRVLEGAATRRERFPLAAMPLAAPIGFHPLLLLVALEGDDHVWARELGVPLPGGTAR